MPAPSLYVSDFITPAVAAAAFVAAMSLLKEPTRRSFNAILAAGAASAYLSGGLGPWELIYPLVAGFVSYFGLRSYRFIGLAWLMHAGWDTVHHFYGNPIWPFMPTSSFGCLIFDSLIGLWFLAGAPSLFSLWSREPTAATDALRAT